MKFNNSLIYTIFRGGAIIFFILGIIVFLMLKFRDEPLLRSMGLSFNFQRFYIYLALELFLATIMFFIGSQKKLGYLVCTIEAVLAIACMILIVFSLPITYFYL